jgi:replicative DNA helicase
MPKRLLRSVIEFDKEVTPENLVRNFQLLQKTAIVGQLEWNRPEDDQIYKYVLGFFIQHFEMPSIQTVLDYFQGVKAVDVIERLKDIQAERPYARTNFVHLLQSIQEDQAKIKTVALLKETHEILIKGVEDKKTKTVRKGVEDSILHFTKRSQEIRVIDAATQIHGDIRKDGEKMLQEYALAETDKSRIYGVLSGINEIDDICKGVKKGELWIHAAFPSELKTMLATNWSYNAVTRYKKNVVYISFEMPIEQIRRNIYTIHSTNARFAQKGHKPLDYQAIRDGLLTPEEKDFYINQVIPDFTTNPTYCHFEVVTPDREWTMSDVQSQIELFHKEFEVGLVILDHGQWIEPRKRNKDYTIELNSVINDAKSFALHFDHNNKIPVLMLFQINRAGKEAADKNDGIYKLNALTYANACIVEDTLITTNIGFMPLKSISPGSKIWNSTGWCEVKTNFDNGIRPVVEVTTDHGVKVRVTNDHRFKTISSNGLEWTQAKDLNEKYVLHVSHNLKMVPQKVVSVEPIGIARVRDLEIVGNPEYTAGSLLVHNCEKTADIITTTYLNDALRSAGLTKFTNLKNRDNPLFKPFEAHVKFSCRRILSAKRMEPQGFSVEDHDEYLETMDVAL